jgi:hypothetical protein
MKFFTDECHDTVGYLEQLEQLQTRLPQNVYELFSDVSFHDAHIYSINVTNTFIPDTGGEEPNPTQIDMHLVQRNGEEYVVRWNGVNRFLMDYDMQRNTYIDSDEIVCDGLRGLDEWMIDEITVYDEQYLSHEIALASATILNIRFTSIELKKL